MVKKRARGFRVGQHVVYPSHGVGKIRKIEEQEIAGTMIEMFEIYVERDKLTLLVPTKKAKEVGMRKTASTNEVEEAMTTLKGKPVRKKLMWSRRAKEFDEKINSGEIMQIAEVVRDLHRRDDQTEQSYSERQLFESAFDRLGREIAVVTGISQDDASEKMQKVLVARKL
ncbi:MAG: CarD family transcriptional regulator [Rhodobacteraceae bacterium]|nr:CarD family transcriptional regulator [Paracoccaceae bacterium]MCY4197008.1 CarD family transcriptional regulator [Paracoccaceae bacterium]